MTLHYESGAWRPYPWAYPDYAADSYHACFESARQRLKDQLRNM